MKILSKTVSRFALQGAAAVIGFVAAACGASGSDATSNLSPASSASGVKGIEAKSNSVIDSDKCCGKKKDDNEICSGQTSKDRCNGESDCQWTSGDCPTS